MKVYLNLLSRQSIDVILKTGCNLIQTSPALYS